MVVIQLQGGLGNQLFQYAFARKVSLLNNTELYVDTSFLDSKDQSVTYRNYALADFNTRAVKASAFQAYLFGITKRKLFFYLLYLLKKLTGSLLIIEEKKLSYDERNLLRSSKDMFFKGYFQSEKYFESIRPVLLQELTPRVVLSKPEQDTLNHIEATLSVAVHIRRGDYASNPSVLQTHGICTLSYYQAAMDHFRSLYPAAIFYMFSDDISWVKMNFDEQDDLRIVDHDSKPATDLLLMSRCKHQVIANSTFSWWAAWLNTNAAKTVIAPKKWFADPNLDAKDIIPEPWTKL